MQTIHINVNVFLSIRNLIKKQEPNELINFLEVKLRPGYV